MDKHEIPGLGMRTAIACAYDYAPGEDIPPHAHYAGQFDYATSGVMTVKTEHGSWVVPPSRAVWIPPRTEHEAQITGAVAMRTVFVAPGLCARMPGRCVVVSVSPLLRELILAAINVGDSDELSAPAQRLIAVLLDRVRAAEILPGHLARPREPRLRRLTDELLRDLSDGRTLPECAAALGMAPRTFARFFHRETGMSFGAWRQQQRLMESMRLLAGGATVTEAALGAGYDSTSAFIVMFRRAMGVSPGRFFAEART
jgi:AraC-like DNA-binding protein